MGVDQALKALDVSGLVAGYGAKLVINNVDFSVDRGEVVAIIGHNGSGKSTALKAVFGLLTKRKGSVLLHGTDVSREVPHELIRRGLGFCPQGGRVYRSLSVIENLNVGGYSLHRKDRSERIEEVFAVLPLLKDKLNQAASSLSGGERQLLAIALCLLNRPSVLMVDEPSAGLSASRTLQILDLLVDRARRQHLALIVVEQKVRDVLRVSDRVYVLRRGEVAHTGCSSDLLTDEATLKSVFFE